ncbi:hypothetical protein KUCAC02_018207, partial [Chaenocephalus aceratus]
QVQNLACLLRSCTRCLYKHTLPTPQQEQTNVEWQQWERVQDQTADGLHFNTRLCPSNTRYPENNLELLPHLTWEGNPDGIGGTVKRTADSLILRGNDIVDGNIFHEMVGRSLCSTKLYIINEADMPYDALLSQPLKPVPATRKLHQVTPTPRNNSEIHCRSLSCFCSEPQMCECFCPTIFQLIANTPRVQVEDDGPIPMQKTKGPLEMLMEEMEQEESEQQPMIRSGPDGTMIDLSADVVHCGDWLAVISDQNWWLAKAVTVDALHQDVKVEFFHPHGPNTRFYPKEVEGGKDMCFIPFDHILVKLVEPSSPGRASRTREIYNLSAEVMDFIEEKHIHHIGLRPDKAE